MRKRMVLATAGRCGNDSGMTLIEVLVALAVVAIASTAFAVLFYMALALDSSNRGNKIAADLAEAQLSYLRLHPQLFKWPDPAAMAPDQRVPLELKDPTVDPMPIHAPGAAPTEERSGRRERAFYERFDWNAFVLMPAEGAEYLELILAIQWNDKGRQYQFALTSSVPKSVAEENQ